MTDHEPSPPIHMPFGEHPISSLGHAKGSVWAQLPTRRLVGHPLLRLRFILPDGFSRLQRGTPLLVRG